MADEPHAIPRHIAIIMDGNGRWARSRNLPRIKGHEKGAEAIRECVEGCGDLGVKYLTLYAFSTENWKRPKPEVDALMELLERFLEEKTQEMLEKNVRFRAIGRTNDLPASCLKGLERAIADTSDNDGLTLILALSYGGREEIVDAARAAIAATRSDELDPNALDVDLFSRFLYTAEYPDPDLLIRTSGELRLSNFLLWQLSYTEIYVTEKLWPDFTKEDLREAVEQYGKRHRRYGRV